MYKGSQTQVKSNLIGAYPYQGDCSSTKLSKTRDNVKISPPYKLILYYYIEIYIYINFFNLFLTFIQKLLYIKKITNTTLLITVSQVHIT